MSLPELVKNARDLATRTCERRAYASFLRSSIKKGERSKRAERRTERGALTKNWTPEQLADKTVLVIGEDGLGDEILTIGCLAELIPSCRSVGWKTNPKLVQLFTRSFPNVSFISGDTDHFGAKGAVYSWELVERFRKDLAAFPWMHNNSVSYLHCPVSIGNGLITHYTYPSRKVIGLAWRSDREGKTCSIRDVVHWGIFFERLKENVQFISLQYGDTRDDITFARWKYGVEIYQDQSVDIFNDVDAAAAQIAAVDYVVSISTTAAHLAGALGVPGWVLLPVKAFGHWQAGKELCPWYPSLTPVRQPTPGDWEHVLKTVTEKLEGKIAEVGDGDSA